MAPERFTPDPMPIKASDIWSLGASIYELCCGELPFSGLGGGMQNSGAAMPSLDHRWSPEMNLVMQSCLAKEPWNRPTAAQLELYASQMLASEVAVITWNQPESDDADAEDSDKSCSVPTGLWILLGIIVVAVAVYAIISCYGNHTYSVEEVIVEDSIVCDSIAVEDIEDVKDYDALAPEPAIEQRENNSSPAKIASPSPKPQAPTQDERFTRAKANNDYTALQQLANEGYKPAYGPLASHYLAIDKYDAANTYAQKAKAAGYAEGNRVIETLYADLAKCYLKGSGVKKDERISFTVKGTRFFVHIVPENNDPLYLVLSLGINLSDKYQLMIVPFAARTAAENMPVFFDNGEGYVVFDCEMYAKDARPFIAVLPDMIRALQKAYDNFEEAYEYYEVETDSIISGLQNNDGDDDDDSSSTSLIEMILSGTQWQ